MWSAHTHGGPRAHTVVYLPLTSRSAGGCGVAEGGAWGTRGGGLAGTRRMGAQLGPAADRPLAGRGSSPAPGRLGAGTSPPPASTPRRTPPPHLAMEGRREGHGIQ